jgi:stage V sporulation protein SpoVS
MSEEIKRPLNSEELATLDKAAAALVKARHLLAPSGVRFLGVGDIITEIWKLTDEARTPMKLA